MTFRGDTTGSPAKILLRNERKNSILMTYNYFPDLSLVEAKFSYGKTNHKYCPDLDKDTSLVWNFCARSSDVFSRGNQWWPRAMSAFFSG